MDGQTDMQQWDAAGEMKERECGRVERPLPPDHHHHHLTCTLPVAGRPPLGQLGRPVAVGRLGGRLVHALLHPLHHQVQQRDHRHVHLRARGRTRLEVGDPAGEGRGGQECSGVSDLFPT